MRRSLTSLRRGRTCAHRGSPVDATMSKIDFVFKRCVYNRPAVQTQTNPQRSLNSEFRVREGRDGVTHVSRRIIPIRGCNDLCHRIPIRGCNDLCHRARGNPKSDRDILGSGPLHGGLSRQQVFPAPNSEVSWCTAAKMDLGLLSRRRRMTHRFGDG
jgi:hypothetical protein